MQGCMFLVPEIHTAEVGQVWHRHLSRAWVNVWMVSGDVTYDEYNNMQINTFSWGCLVASLVLNVWSICDAVHIAKVKNMYYQDIRAQRSSLDFKIEPFLSYTPSGASTNTLAPTAGLAMKYKKPQTRV